MGRGEWAQSRASPIAVLASFYPDILKLRFYCFCEHNHKFYKRQVEEENKKIF